MPELPELEILKNELGASLLGCQVQEVIVLDEESGWAWVRTTLGEEGWIPLENLQGLKEKPDSIPDLSRGNF